LLYLNFQKASLLFALTSIALTSWGQPSIRKTDGVTVYSNTTFFSTSIKSKESSATDYITFYQKYISDIRGQECPMYPSCSNFGLKSFKETGFAKAFVLTSDRLMRCGHDLENYALMLGDSGFKNLDYPYYDRVPADLYYKGNAYFYSYSDTVRDTNPSITLIKSLINDELFNEALLEIKRLQHSKSLNNHELFVNELICLKALGEFEKAIYGYEMRCPLDLKSDPEILYQLSINYSNLNNFEKASDILTQAVRNANDDYLKTKLYSFQAALYAKQYKWKESTQALEHLRTLPFPRQTLEDKLSFLKEELPLREKKPALGSFISIIPGAGYAYAGHKQTAISALIINGLLTYATYSNLKNKNYGMSMLTGMFNLSFYIGNIYGASKSVKRFNEQQKQNLSNKLIYNLYP
jgi:putative component of membrane protein insertase Oxa1/YidC/SpoIIIJ protein YidD